MTTTYRGFGECVGTTTELQSDDGYRSVLFGSNVGQVEFGRRDEDEALFLDDSKSDLGSDCNV